jgi:hypothetical protein
MKSILPLAVLVAAHVNAQQPSLTTTPDIGFPFVQENTDKTMKLALLVAGESCQIGTPLTGQARSFLGMQSYTAITVIWNEPLSYVVSVADNSKGADVISVDVYQGQVEIPQDRSLVSMRQWSEQWHDLLQRKQLSYIDIGIDGNVNFGMEGTKIFRSKDIQSRPQYQTQYLATLDTVLALCEGR